MTSALVPCNFARSCTYVFTCACLYSHSGTVAARAAPSVHASHELHEELCKVRMAMGGELLLISACQPTCQLCLLLLSLLCGPDAWRLPDSPHLEMCPLANTLQVEYDVRYIGHWGRQVPAKLCHIWSWHMINVALANAAIIVSVHHMIRQQDVNAALSPQAAAQPDGP